MTYRKLILAMLVIFGVAVFLLVITWATLPPQAQAQPTPALSSQDADYIRLVIEDRLDEARQNIMADLGIPAVVVDTPGIDTVLGLLGTDVALLTLGDATSAFTSIGHQTNFAWVYADTLEPRLPARSTQNGIPTVQFDGNLAAIAADSPWWSPGNGEVDRPFMVSLWVNPDFTDRCDFNLFGKYDITGKKQGQREWLLQFETCNSILGSMRDESTNNVLKPRWTGLPSPFGWTMLTLTYDGTPGIGGYTIYSNGVAVNNGATVYLPYVAMEDTTAPMTLGSMWMNRGPFQTFIGEMAGGYCGPVFAYGSYTASDVSAMYDVCAADLR